MSFYNAHTDNEGFSDFEAVSTSRTITPLNGVPMPQGDEEVWDDSASIMSGMSHDSEWYGDDQMTLNGQYTYREDNPETFGKVPPLDLRSEMNFSMDSLPEMITHHAKLNQPCKSSKQSNTTYELWLQKKLEKQTQEAARKKREEQRREDEVNARKQQAEEKYQAWLSKKRQQEARYYPECRASTSSVCGSGSGSASGSGAASTSEYSSSPASSSSSSTALPPKVVSMTTCGPTISSQNPQIIDRKTEKQKKMEAWERAKREQAEKRRMQKKREEEERLKLEEKRKEESQAAYNRWQKSNKNRPKPVPLNQGMLSLRGTVSDIFINPNEWQSILD